MSDTAPRPAEVVLDHEELLKILQARKAAGDPRNSELFDYATNGVAEGRDWNPSPGSSFPVTSPANR